MSNGSGIPVIMNLRDTFKLCLEVCDWITQYDILRLNVASLRGILGITKKFADTHFIAETIRAGAILPLMVQARSEPMCNGTSFRCSSQCMFLHEIFHVSIDSPECMALIKHLGYHRSIRKIVEHTENAVSLMIMGDPVWGLTSDDFVSIALSARGAGNMEKFWYLVRHMGNMTKTRVFWDSAKAGDAMVVKTMLAVYSMDHVFDDGYNPLDYPKPVRKVIGKYRIHHGITDRSDTPSTAEAFRPITIGFRGGNINPLMYTSPIWYSPTLTQATSRGFRATVNSDSDDDAPDLEPAPAPPVNVPRALGGPRDRSLGRMIKSENKSLHRAQKLQRQQRR